MGSEQARMAASGFLKEEQMKNRGCPKSRAAPFAFIEIVIQ